MGNFGFIISGFFFLLSLSFSNSLYLGILGIFHLLFIFLKNLSFCYFEVKSLKFLFLFLTLWLLYFLMKCSGNFNGVVFILFYFIFFMCFLTKKMMVFFIFFELSLVPTYFLVMKGSTPERMVAGNYLILYTFLGSLPLIFSILALGGNNSFFYNIFFFSLIKGYFYFFILAFLIKLPIFFFHLWLPKAHVEASTEGSMILAGILLKLGSYGLIIFCQFLFLKIYLGLMVGFGGILAGVFSLVQMDLKSYMAYSSIIHMSYMVISSFGVIFLSLLGVIYMSVGHGFISAGMFYMLSLVYNFTGSRKMYFLKGILKFYFFAMLFCGFCLILNSSAPMSMKFFGEIFMFIGGSVVFNIWNFILVFFMKVLGGLISILFFLLMFHGSSGLKSFKMSFQKISILFFMKVYSFIFFPLFNLF